ncbi:MAG: hypothetical protein JSR34_10285 [Proteobacteria bacterium]|nr:hypothetical protein [Pseudomonadota bacterium]
MDRDPGLQAVVVSHDGQAIPGQSVQVAIERVNTDAHASAPSVVGHCELSVDRATPCTFRAPKPGLYRFRASAQGAAPTVLERWIGERAPVTNTEDKAKAGLKLVQASDGTHPARVELTQPYRRARVLFTLEYGKVVRHWVQALPAGASTIEVPIQTAWAPGVTVHALVRSANPDAPDGGFATPTLDATLDIAIPKPPTAAIAVSVERPRLPPGQDLVLHLANAAGGLRHATIAVVDDSIYQQSQDMAAQADPARDGWLADLALWQTTAWYGLEGWKAFGNPFFVAPKPSIPPSPKEMPAPKVADVAGRIGGSGLVTTPAPQLDRVEVIGSRIKRTVDTFGRSQAVTVLPPREGAAQGGRSLPQVRSRFLDTAYWNADLPLAAGQSQDLHIHLPDNLTRWRVLVWTYDAEDGFALRQATAETALPVELRAGTPARLFVGDHATASVSARNHGNTPARIGLRVQADGAGVKDARGRQDRVAGNAEISQPIALTPTLPGDVQILARADKPGGGDALAAGVPVESTLGASQVVQAGWLDADALNLPLPTLPVGAMSPVLEVQVHRGLSGWQQGWLRDLRDYPNRCWEQTLSRAVGAALAIDSGQDKALWLDAKQVVRDAMTVAPMFQDEEGGFRYFIASYGDWRGPASPALSAYTLRSFEFLQGLGFQPPQEAAKILTGTLADKLRTFGTDPPQSAYDPRWETAAEAAGAILGPGLLEDKALTALWNGWGNLSWYGRAELVRALARKPALAAQAQAGIARLRLAGTQRGLRRVIADSRDFSFVMGSDLRDQCGVVGALYELDHGSAGETARRSLLRGLQDLYAGGTASLDTQSSAQCLMALHTVAATLPKDDQAWSVLATLGSTAHPLALAAGQQQAQWTQPLEAKAAGLPLRLQSQSPASATLNYSAQLSYQIDLRQAPAQAVGMQLERSYQVLREHAWVDLDKAAPLRAGEWVRVTLTLAVPAFRHFVAITDAVPGGLVSRDVALAGIAGADLKRLADPGSWWFDSRQTGANTVRLYAESLPPGTHEVHYYAQAAQPGTYFAPPATAELMYGRASRATTAGTSVVILPAPTSGRDRGH